MIPIHRFYLEIGNLEPLILINFSLFIGASLSPSFTIFQFFPMLLMKISCHRQEKFVILLSALKHDDSFRYVFHEASIMPRSSMMMFPSFDERFPHDSEMRMPYFILIIFFIFFCSEALFWMVLPDFNHFHLRITKFLIPFMVPE